MECLELVAHQSKNSYKYIQVPGVGVTAIEEFAIRKEHQRWRKKGYLLNDAGTGMIK